VISPDCETMKKTDLEKNKGLKILGQMKQSGTPGRFGKSAAVVLDKREQRKIDQAKGLLPFAVKLDGELVKQIQALAQERKASVAEVVTELLKKSLKS
jgi:hypothetical protein